MLYIVGTKYMYVCYRFVNELKKIPVGETEESNKHGSMDLQKEKSD